MRRTPSMTVRDLAARQVVTVAPDTSLARCGAIMREQHVGSVVVVEDGRPVGIVTDRDIVLETVAQSLDPASITAADVMPPTLGTVAEDDDLVDVVARMRELGVRRIPMVDSLRRLTGIVALDDVFSALAEQLAFAVDVVAAERTREGSTRPSA